jgi:2-deoxy-D-gluconate 3-dehydrogenase
MKRDFKAYQRDFGNRKLPEDLIEKELFENQQIDILVNNVGTIMRKPAPNILTSIGIK